MVRAERTAWRRVRVPMGQVLSGQAEDEVEVDVVEPGPARALERLRGLLRRVDAANRLSIASSKDCTPMLSRLTPAAR